MSGVKMTIRIGGCCMWLNDDGTRDADNNMRCTNVRGLTGRETVERMEWLWYLIGHNMSALRNQLRGLRALPPALRMWRISSELLPVATHEITADFYAIPEVQEFLQRKLLKLGNYARKHGIRLSFHPAQFVVLGSQNKFVRQNAMKELAYHAQVFEWMGYKGWHHDGVAINVHVGPKDAAVDEMRAAIKDAPDGVKNFLTLENEEFCWDADRITDTFGDLVPIVLDIHHYWITHGKQLKPDSKLVGRIRETWRGIQPKLHHATTERDLCEGQSRNKPLRLLPLMDVGHPKGKLRVHSLHPWHKWSNEYACSFGFDVMWEGRSKNIGAAQIAEQVGIVPRGTAPKISQFISR